MRHSFRSLSYVSYCASWHDLFPTFSFNFISKLLITGVNFGLTKVSATRELKCWHAFFDFNQATRLVEFQCGDFQNMRLSADTNSTFYLHILLLDAKAILLFLKSNVLSKLVQLHLLIKGLNDLSCSSAWSDLCSMNHALPHTWQKPVAGYHRGKHMSRYWVVGEIISLNLSFLSSRRTQKGLNVKFSYGIFLQSQSYGFTWFQQTEFRRRFTYWITVIYYILIF